MRRSLSREEATLWARVAGTVVPINPPYSSPLAGEESAACSAGASEAWRGGRRSASSLPSPTAASSLRSQAFVSSPARGEDLRNRPQTLDASWDRKLAHGLVQPDFTLDLHGYSLDAAHTRLDHGLALALVQGARLVLLITGRQRPSDGHGGRGERRGAIRAKFLDWLATGSHGSRIAAIRPAHPRHGGAGAVYVVLRRAR